MKKVYICSPCRGDYENNIQRAKEFSRAAVERGCIPVTPHIYLTQFMDDTVPAERELARERGIPVRNGYEAISEIGEPEKKDEEPKDAGSVVLHIPAFRALAICNEYLNHGPITVELDGRIIFDLAERLKDNPGSRLEIGG